MWGLKWENAVAVCGDTDKNYWSPTIALLYSLVHLVVYSLMAVEERGRPKRNLINFSTLMNSHTPLHEHCLSMNWMQTFSTFLVSCNSIGTAMLKIAGAGDVMATSPCQQSYIMCIFHSSNIQFQIDFSLFKYVLSHWLSIFSISIVSQTLSAKCLNCCIYLGRREKYWNCYVHNFIMNSCCASPCYWTL